MPLPFLSQRILLGPLRVNWSVKVVLLFLLATVTSTQTTQAQTVTEIVTDFGSFWKASTTLPLNSVKPNTSHNLLAFTYNGSRYSTGANDAVLSSNGLSFTQGDYRALPVYSIAGTLSSNTFAGLGAAYDGVTSGASSPAPSGSLATYLTDGLHGLNLGTGIANLPAGPIEFSVDFLQLASIGDGVPDILVTQIAQTSTTTDTYAFTNDDNVVIGNSVSINVASLSPLGYWMADFYQANVTPMTLAGGYTNTQRELRLYAADFSIFGINSGNYASIKKFKITLNGASDLAFVAYNYKTVNVNNGNLPVRFTSFTATPREETVQLSWQTASETNSDRFVIERSTDGERFNRIDSVTAAGYSVSLLDYACIDRFPADMNYYRIRQVDRDGKFYITKIVAAAFLNNKNGIGVLPNPANHKTMFKYPGGPGNELVVTNICGERVLRKSLLDNVTETPLDLTQLQNGEYIFIWTDGKRHLFEKVIVQH